MTLTDPDCPLSVRDQINGGVTQEARQWHRSDRASGDVMLYTLRQDGWRKGDPVMVNDVTILIEAAPGSAANVKQIAAALHAALQEQRP